MKTLDDVFGKRTRRLRAPAERHGTAADPPAVLIGPRGTYRGNAEAAVRAHGAAVALGAVGAAVA